MSKSTCDPHMFQGILWATAHEEKYPLTTAAATRSSKAAVKSVTVPPWERPTIPMRPASTRG